MSNPQNPWESQGQPQPQSSNQPQYGQGYPTYGAPPSYGVPADAPNHGSQAPGPYGAPPPYGYSGQYGQPQPGQYGQPPYGYTPPTININMQNNQQVGGYGHHYVSSQKDYMTALLLSVFFGIFGVDRFYLGYTVLGVLKLLTGGGFMIWWILDIISIASRNLRDADGLPLRG